MCQTGEGEDHLCWVGKKEQGQGRVLFALRLLRIIKQVSIWYFQLIN